MGLNQSAVTAITDGWQATVSATDTAVVAANGFSWQLLARVTTPTPAQCTAIFARECGSNPIYAATAFRYEFTEPKTRPLPQVTTDLASFLLVRGDYAWIGHGWIGCITADSPPASSPAGLYYRPPELDVDYGVPRGQCRQDGKKFYRSYTKAEVMFDCDAYLGNITLLPG